MLEKAGDIVNEVKAIIAADGLTDIAVADTQQKLADAQAVVTRSQQADVRDTKADRRQSLRRLCRGASEHTASIKDVVRARQPAAPAKGERGHNPLLGSAGKSNASRQPHASTTWERGRASHADNASRQPVAPMKLERGPAVPATTQKRRHRQQDRRRRKVQ